MAKHILIIEDDTLLQETYADILGEEFTVHTAFTVKDAESLFLLHRNSLGAVVVDACVPGNTPNTIPLVRYMRAAGFEGPIIATSGDPDFQEELMRAGCSHQSGKAEVIATLQDLLT